MRSGHYYLLLSAFLAIALSSPARAQSGGARQIIPEEFVKARPAKSAAGSARRPAYRRVSSPSAAARTSPRARSSNFTQLGLTIWRLRPSTTADSGARIVVHESDEVTEWTPERVAAGVPLRVGERVRLSIESPQTGYLYVVDREQYADGTLGEPYLIFPTTRTRGGDNQVTAGRLIEIPGQEDRPNYFRLRQSRPDQVGEALTVLVTAQPIEGLSPGPKPLVLAPEQVAQWEKMWGARVERFELAGGAGKTWTKAEQAAGADGMRLLTQEDPGPQTVYRVAVKPGAPILVKVGLRYRRSRSTARAAAPK
jgi:hypothetical protein